MQLRINRNNESLLEDLAAFMGIPDRADRHEIEWTIRTTEAAQRVADLLADFDSNEPWEVEVLDVSDDFDGAYKVLGANTPNEDEGPVLRLEDDNGVEVLNGVALLGSGGLYVP